MIFITIVVNDPRVCHDLKPISYFQGQGLSEHIAKLRARGITALLPYLIWIIYFTIVVNDPRACYSLTLMSCLQGQGHS